MAEFDLPGVECLGDPLLIEDCRERVDLVINSLPAAPSDSLPGDDHLGIPDPEGFLPSVAEL